MHRRLLLQALVWSAFLQQRWSEQPETHQETPSLEKTGTKGNFRRGNRPKVKMPWNILPLQWWMAEPGHHMRGKESRWTTRKIGGGLDFLKLMGKCNLRVITAAWRKGHNFPDPPLIPHTWTCFFLLSRALKLPCYSCVALWHFLLCLSLQLTFPTMLLNSACLSIWVAEMFVLSHLQAQNHRRKLLCVRPCSVSPLTKGLPCPAFPRAPPSTQNVPLLLQMAELLTGLYVSFHVPFPSLSISFPVQGLRSFFPQLCTWLLCLRRCLFAGQLLSCLAWVL